MFGLLRMTHGPVAEFGKPRRAVLIDEPQLGSLQMEIARARVPNVETRRAFLRCKNAESVSAAFLRNGDFDTGICFECLGQRFTPGQWDGAKQAELLLRRLHPR